MLRQAQHDNPNPELNTRNFKIFPRFFRLPFAVPQLSAEIIIFTKNCSMRHYLFVLFAGLVLCLTSCRDDFEFEQSAGGLEFSRDTVYLDTVFTNIGSSTYTLKVYNRSDKDIAIPSVRLKKADSKYRLMVDGMSGQSFNNVELMAHDSMYVFIETTVDITQNTSANQFLYTDEIEFTSTTGVQEVNLVTLIKDAYFLYPQRNDLGQYESVRFDSESNTGEPVYVRGFNLDHADPNNGDEYHWNNSKPYVIYGYATVPAGETLNIDPGARVHFHAESGLMVRPGATLKVNGLPSSDPEVLENEVIFEGDRLEPGFSELAGQWGTVMIMSAEANTISNLTIKNSGVGLFFRAPDGDTSTIPNATLYNVQVYNSSTAGILTRRSTVTADNVVINNAGTASLACTLGGTYTFRHCTFANYNSTYNQVPVLVADNMENEDGSISVAPLNATFANCIAYGSGSFAIRHSREGEDLGVAYNVAFNNCFIRFTDYSNQFSNNPLYKFDNSGVVDYTGSSIARNTTTLKPDFTDPQRNDLTIGPDSAAIGLGDPLIAAQVPLDILGVSRAASADAGAYVHTSE